MRWLKVLVYLPTALLLAFVIVEAGVRGIYAYARHQTVLYPMLYERVYWAELPPWVRSMSLFTTDPEVGLWMKPHLDRTYINLFGPIGNLTPAGHVEVINYGSIGGTAETGRRLTERALALDPDLIVVAYAQNDEGAVRDGKPAFSFDERALPLRARLPFIWTRVRASIASYELLEYLRTRSPVAIEASLKRSITRPKRQGDNEATPACRNARAADTPYRAAIDALVTAALARHVDVVLVYNNVPESLSHCTRIALSEVAGAHGVPLVDVSALLGAKGAELRADAERLRNLVPPPAPPGTPGIITTAVFRVDMAGEPGRPCVMGNMAALGHFQPNVTPLHDDGTHGDQLAGDGVWSLAVPVAGFRRIAYVYTNGDTRGAWEGLENYQPRIFAVTPQNAGGTLYLPVPEFGRVVLRSDPAHPDADGAALIAEALAHTIRSRPAWNAYRAARGGAVDPAGRPRQMELDWRPERVHELP